jgi:metallophosphoesterase superfamily enzyme
MFSAGPVAASALAELDEAVRRVPGVGPVEYVQGNHDAGLAEIVGPDRVHGSLEVGGFGIRHGHARRNCRETPQPAIFGHEHPTLSLRTAVGARMRFPAFLKVEESWILPALSPWASGVNIAAARAFHGPELASHDPADADAYVVGPDAILPFGRVRHLVRRGFA